MRVESAGPNKYNLIFSGDNVETVVADGTDQPALFGTTLAIIVHRCQRGFVDAWRNSGLRQDDAPIRKAISSSIAV
jgi:hypothetical protein